MRNRAGQAAFSETLSPPGSSRSNKQLSVKPAKLGCEPSLLMSWVNGEPKHVRAFVPDPVTQICTNPKRFFPENQNVSFAPASVPSTDPLFLLLRAKYSIEHTLQMYISRDHALRKRGSKLSIKMPQVEPVAADILLPIVGFSFTFS